MTYLNAAPDDGLKLYPRFAPSEMNSGLTKEAELNPSGFTRPQPLGG